MFGHDGHATLLRPTPNHGHDALFVRRAKANAFASYPTSAQRACERICGGFHLVNEATERPVPPELTNVCKEVGVVHT